MKKRALWFSRHAPTAAQVAGIAAHWSHGVAVGYQIGEKDDGDYIELLPEPFFYAPTWSKKGAVK